MLDSLAIGLNLVNKEHHISQPSIQHFNREPMLHVQQSRSLRAISVKFSSHSPFLFAPFVPIFSCVCFFSCLHSLFRIALSILSVFFVSLCFKRDSQKNRNNSFCFCTLFLLTSHQCLCDSRYYRLLAVDMNFKFDMRIFFSPSVHASCVRFHSYEPLVSVCALCMLQAIQCDAEWREEKKTCTTRTTFKKKISISTVSNKMRSK